MVQREPTGYGGWLEVARDKSYLQDSRLAAGFSNDLIHCNGSHEEKMASPHWVLGKSGTADAVCPAESRG